MALFKILQGSAEGLKNLKATEGYAYFTPDDGTFYIDIDSTTSANDVRIGNNDEETVNGELVNRICINQRVFTYSDYDILNCGTSTDVVNLQDLIIFDCN